MIKTLIVDDEPLARERIATLLSRHSEIDLVGECGDGESAIDRLMHEEIDLVFLDVQMPGLDGMSVAELVPSERLPVVIFVTAYDEYALRAFRAHALDYLLKPVITDVFDQTLDRARTWLRGRAQTSMAKLTRELRGGDYRRRIAVRKNDRILVLRVDEISLVEAQGNYIRVHTDRGAFLMRELLHQFLSAVDPNVFLRVHRSAAVNVERVRELVADGDGHLQAVLQDSKTVPVGAAYRAAVEDVFGLNR